MRPHIFKYNYNPTIYYNSYDINFITPTLISSQLDKYNNNTWNMENIVGCLSNIEI